MNKIIRYFPDSNLRSGHRGLAMLAAKNGIKVNSLGAGEFLIFVNKRQNMLKMFASGNIIAHYKKEDGSRIDPRTIAHIPRHFSGSKINYDAALVQVLRREFKGYA